MPYANIEKQRLFQKAWKRKTKNWFWELKASLKCVKCGFSHPAAIQFHHRENNKTKEVGRMVNQNLNREVIMAEIAKCDVFCANCHAIHHYENDYVESRNL